MVQAIDDKFKGQNYTVFRDYLSSCCGITLGDNKHYLVSSRLNTILEHYELADLIALVRALERRSVPRLQEKIIDAMTTNETLWFRDAHPFTCFSETLLPELLQKSNGSPIRIWSAAASTGQECYSLSIAIDEYFHVNAISNRVIEIVGTDISEAALAIAKTAEYDELSLNRGLSKARRERYFEPVPGEKTWRVKPEIKQRVSFRQFNLLDKYLLLGAFDIVFCRNVLIYFSQEVKQDILTRIASTLKPQSYLFLGGTESMGDAIEHYDMLRNSSGIYYRLK